MKSIKTEDILVLIQWVYSMHSFEMFAKNDKFETLSESELMKIIEKEYVQFKYSELMSKAVANEKKSFEVSDLEDFFVDAYMVYDKIKKNQHKIEEKMSESKLMSFLPEKIIDSAKDEMKKFISIFEFCIKTADFETANMRGIQKNMLSDFMNDLIKEEKYEECTLLRDKINSF